MPEAEEGTTLAAFLRARHADLSWSKAKEIGASGRVLVDGESTSDPALRLLKGARIELLDEGSGPLADDGIRHLDSDVVVVVKPAGVLTVPFEDGDRDTLWHRATVAVRRRERRPGKTAHSAPLRAVQRLDKETSGLLVFARTVPAQRELQEELKSAKLDRVYEAVVLGALRSKQRIESFLLEDRGDGLRGSWRPRAGSAEGGPPRDARRAATQVEPIEILGEGRRTATHVRCRLETGRTHQIRIHLSEAGHPVLGDRVYGRGTSAAEWPGPMMLHAAQLEFRHPRTGRPMQFEEPPPQAFAQSLEALRSPSGR